MSYTTVTNVAGMFPTFKTGGSNQAPSNTLIQQYIDDVAGDIDAILQRRFAQQISESYGGSFSAFQAAFSTDATNVLEKINRYGACAQLGLTLATMGVAAAERLAKDFEAEFEARLGDLGAYDERGEAMASGLYDYLFDPQSATETPRPALQGVAGGDQPRGESAREEGLDDYFWKSERF
jgi:hypothetical protein